MADVEPTDSYTLLWRAALRDASGLLAAYITPEGFGLANPTVRPGDQDEDEAFAQQISARLDLGRTHAFLSLASVIGGSTTSSYRHEVSYSERVIRGKVHVPRWVQEHARGRGRYIPTIRAERQLETPENLMVSEAIQVSIQVARAWTSHGGAESVIAKELLRQLMLLESEAPWAQLRTKPRDSLRSLVEVVRGRLESGVTPKGDVIEQVVQLFSPRGSNVSSFESAVTPLSMLIVEDSAFEDRLFELLCLAWISSALRSLLDDVVVRPTALKGKNKDAIVEGTRDGHRVRLYFQRSVDLLPVGRWIYHHSGSALKAIPDIVIEIVNHQTGVKRLVLLDAKNRRLSSASEVAYKLIGYQDNLGLTPYLAYGIYPSFKRDFVTKKLQRGPERTITLLEVPIVKGRRAAKSLCRTILMKQLPNSP